MSAAEWDAVTIRYPDARYAVGPASFGARPGERVLVLGPSGSGKSSLLLALTGLIPEAIPAAVDGGTRILGIDARRRRAAQWADRVAHVFQAPERNLCGMSVEEEIAFALEQSGLCEDRIRTGVAGAMKAVGLDASMAGRPVATLSGGEKQRVCLAATLAQGGDVLLIDEPTAHLNRAAAQRIHAVLSEPSRAATVIVDHRLDGLIGAIDRVVVLDGGGCVFAEGAPREVFRDHIECLDALGIWVPEAARLDRMLRAAGIMQEPMPLRLERALENLPATSAAVDAISCYCAAAPLDAGVRPSMGSVGDAYDNAMCESFFATLECELLDRRKFRTKAEAKMAIFQFIEGWYNPGRRHSALGYLSPVNYEHAAKERLLIVSP